MIAAPVSAQTTYQTDFNNTTAGYGASASFNWGTTNKRWSSTGTSATIAWSNAATPNNAILGGSSGTSTYTATLTSAVSVGTISVATGTWIINTAGNTLTFNSSSNSTLPSSVSIMGTGSVTKTGTGALTLSAANSQTGTTTLTAGTLNVATGAALSGATAGLVVNGGTLNLNNTAQTVAALSGTGGTINLGSGHTLAVNSTTTGTYSGIFASTGNLTKNGTGTLTLAGVNTQTGTTTVSAGTVIVSSTGALSGATGSLVVNGGTLTLNNTAQTVAALSGTGGTINLGSGHTLTVNSTTTGTFSGTLASAGSLVKTGSGTLTLSGTNSYTGSTTISGGILSVSALANGGANSSIGASNNTASSLILDGGTLLYTGAGSTSDRLFSVGAAGGTIDASGAGQLTLNNAGSMGFNGSTSARTLTLTGTGTGSLAAIIGDNTGATSLTKNGAGTWTLGGVNTQTGTTTLSAGTLTVNSGAALSGATAGLVVNGGTLNLNNTAQTVSALTGSGGTVNLGPGHTLTVNAASDGTYAGVLGSSGTLTKTGAGVLTLSGSSTGYTGAVNVSGGTLLAANSSALGAGTSGTTVSSGAALGLAGSSLTVANGTLTISGDGVSNSGALYNASGSGTNRWNNSITLGADARIGAAAGTLNLGPNKPGFAPSGHSQPTENSYITLGNSTNSNSLTFSGSGTIVVNSRIQDYSGQTAGWSYLDANTINYRPVAPSGTAGSVTIDMSSGGVVKYVANANTYTGTTYVKNGTLIVDTISNGSTAPHDTTTDSFHGVNGALVIGNGSSTATVQLGQGGSPNAKEALSHLTTVTIYADGTLNLNSQGQTIDALTFTGAANNGALGQVQIGTGATLYLNNNVLVSSTSGTATIGTGNLSMTLHQASGVDSGTANRTFTVTNSGATLQIDAVVQNGTLIKEGAGTLVLNGSNTYTGQTQINNGIVKATSGTSASHSSLGSGDATTAQGTIVASGATLQLSGGIAISDERLHLSGTGYSGNQGALQNVSGNNTWGVAGLARINLHDDARINADSGTTLTILSNIVSVDKADDTTARNKALTVGGSGDVTISGSISTGSTTTTTVTKDGTGTLTLSGNNSYAGATTVSSGVLVAAHNNALGSVTTGTDGTSVSSGAALHLSGGITVGGESLSLSGTGISGNGALRNVSGTNTFGGTVSLGTGTNVATTRIQNDVAGNSLALTGGLITGGSANATLNIGGSGNTALSGNNGGGYTLSGGSSVFTKDGTGTVSLSLSGGSTDNQIGVTHVNAGTLAVTSGTLNTAALDTTISSAVLAVASGAQVTATYSSGSTVFYGTISDVSGDGGGTFKKNGAGELVFAQSFNAGSSSTLILNGGTLKLGNTSGVNVTFGTISITADTTIDFNGSYATTLTAANLLISGGVNVTIINWTSLSDAWYATTQINGNTGSILDLTNQSPLNQITFSTPTNAPATATTWVTTQGGNYFNREIRPTPEPSTYGALFLGACLAFLGYRRWRRSAARR
ncbi:MAG: autotransporter-associated beta strand repeat-containing protein [Verrucomicrobia bacterium]|nr:autotransporter-associated beta strand repeat-containing protein [Verrucomicrobiota bacterium]